MSDFHIFDWHSDGWGWAFSIPYDDQLVVVDAEETLPGQGGLVVEKDAGGDGFGADGNEVSVDEEVFVGEGQQALVDAFENLGLVV